MKSYFVSIAISIFILSRVEPLHAGNIMTPFGPVFDLCYYLNIMSVGKDADNQEKLERCIYFSQHSENGRRPSDISVSAWTDTPADTSTFTYPQSVIELISALSVDNPSKIALFIALIILNQNTGDFDLLSTDGTGCINNIEVSRIYGDTGSIKFIIRLQGTDVTFEMRMDHYSRAEWFITTTRPSTAGRREISDYRVTIRPHSMPLTEQASHHLWRSSCLAGLFMWIGGFFNQAQKP